MSAVLITGCSSGIGLETALAFARRGDATRGDPAVVAEAIVRATLDASAPLHNLVGDDAVGYVEVAARAGSREAWVELATGIVESVAGPRPLAGTPSA